MTRMTIIAILLFAIQAFASSSSKNNPTPVSDRATKAEAHLEPRATCNKIAGASADHQPFCI